MPKRPRSPPVDQGKLEEEDDVTAFPGFRVYYPKLLPNGTLRKGDAKLKAYITTMISPFEPKYEEKADLDTLHAILPAKRWFECKKYSKFVIQGDTFTSSEYMWVRPDGTDPETLVGEDDYWVAKLLEVRAIDPSHVYAKVVWMYRPEQLTKCVDTVSGVKEAGRRSYHGKHEVIASNHIDIVDVTCFAGKAPVEHWLENDEEDIQSGLYWRQTLNQFTGKLSDIRKHCTCGQPYNPDNRMFMCDRMGCEIWLHEECLLDDVLRETFAVHSKTKLPQLVGADEDSLTFRSPSSKSTKATTKSVAQADSKKIYEGRFTGDIIQESDSKPMVHITDLRAQANGPNRNWDEHLFCLKCRQRLE